MRLFLHFTNLWYVILTHSSHLLQPDLHQHHTPLLPACAYPPPNYRSSLGRHVRGPHKSNIKPPTTARYRQPPTVNVPNPRLAAS